MEKGWEKKVLDHGYVKLVDFMGSDESIVEAARMSTGKGFEGWDPHERCKSCGVVRGVSEPGMSIWCASGESHIYEKKPGDAKLLEHLYNAVTLSASEAASTRLVIEMLESKAGRARETEDFERAFERARKKLGL